MKRKVSSHLPTNEKVITYANPGRGWREDLYAAAYPSMLAEDMKVQLIPYRGSPEYEMLTITTRPNTAATGRIIAASLTRGGGFPTPPRDIKEAVVDLIRTMAYTLSLDGTVVYTLVPHTVVIDKQNTPVFGLQSIPPWCIRSIGGVTWQHLPREVASRKGMSKRLRLIDSSLIHRLNFPPELGGRRMHRMTLRRLKALSNSLIPEFELNRLKRRDEESILDHAKYHRLRDMLLARYTEHLGWQCRGSLSDRFLEYYKMEGYLRFKRSLSILREHILGFVGDLVRDGGKLIESPLELEVSGLMTPSEYDEKLIHLREGKLRFVDISRLF